MFRFLIKSYFFIQEIGRLERPKSANLRSGITKIYGCNGTMYRRNFVLYKTNQNFYILIIPTHYEKAH